MAYQIIISADGVSMPELATAQRLFRDTLVAGLGGVDHFSPCFAAYSKGFDHDLTALTPDETTFYGRWLTAYADAEIVVHAALGRSVGVEILVRLAA